MCIHRLLAASAIVLSSLALAADPPKPADNTDVKPPPAQPQQQPQQPKPQRPQQPQRGFGRFGFGQGFQPRDPFVDALNALGDLALTPDFTITTEQKENIQSLRLDQKLATDKWRGDHADDLIKFTEQSQAARDAGDMEKFRDIMQKRRNLMQSGPKPEDAVKKLNGLLNEEQRKRLEERMAQRRAEEEAARQ